MAVIEFNYVVRFSSWESRENDALRFDVRTYDDGTCYSRSIEGVQKSARAVASPTMRMPKELSLDLPAETIFPTEHMRRLIETARNGQTMLTEYVFDGSGPDSLTSVSAIIGRPRDDVVHAEPSRQRRTLAC